MPAIGGGDDFVWIGGPDEGLWLLDWRLPTEFARCGVLPLPEVADLWSDGLPSKRRELSLPLGVI
jgi:hypothetical protein